MLEQVKWPVFLRPRRFGKTLFTQTLKRYYDIKAKDKFEQLFGNLYIGKNPTPKHNTFFVLSLNFSGMDTFVGSEHELKENFYGKVLIQIERFISYYQKEFNLGNDKLSDFHEDYRNDPTVALNKIFEFVEKLGGRLFITIDEYDSLTNALAIRYRYSSPDDNVYLKILQKGGFFRDVIYTFPGQFFANANESFFHGMLFHILYNNMPKNMYEVIPEYNLQNGRVDIMLRSYPAADVEVHLNHLFEIKQVPKSTSDEEFKAKFKLGLDQMEKYLATESSHWKGIVICFRGNKDFKMKIVSKMIS